MSNIPKSERKKSPMDFVDTADKIEERSLQICPKWPKRYMFFITQRTMNLASELYETVQEANAIKPKLESEREERIRLLNHALGVLYAYSKKIERARKTFPLCGDNGKLSDFEKEEKSNTVFEELMGLCKAEKDFLNGNLTYVRNMKLGKSPPNDKK